MEKKVKGYLTSPLMAGRYLVEEWVDWNHMRMMNTMLTKSVTKCLLFNAPPKTGKTTFLGEIFPAWYIRQNPKANVLYVGYNTNEAATRAQTIMQNVIAMGSSRLQLDQDHGHEMNVYIPEIDAGIHALGALAEFDGETGKLMKDKKFDLIIVDDLIKNMAVAEDNEFLEAQYQWVTDVAGGLNAGGRLIIAECRKCKDDLTGHILANKDELPVNMRGYARAVFPMIAEDDVKLGNTTYIKKGELLITHGEVTEQVNALMEVTRTKIGEENWKAIYQQHPV